VEVERGNSRSHSVENSHWKRLLACRKIDYGLHELEKFWCLSDIVANFFDEVKKAQVYVSRTSVYNGIFSYRNL